MGSKRAAYRKKADFNHKKRKEPKPGQAMKES
jgi:hypothetical protein